MITLGIETSCDETALAIIETKINEGWLEYRVISSLINSQAELHSTYGGVFPSLAKREHGKNILPLLKKLLEEAKTFFDKNKERKLSPEEYSEIFKKFTPEISSQNPDLFKAFSEDIEFLKQIPPIDRIAVTEGPGLEPALWVGINFGRIISALWSIPLIPVNHMEGHILGSLLSSDSINHEWQKLKEVEFPAIALLISGGHTELVKIEKKNNSQDNDFKYTILGQTKDDAVGEAFDKVARILGLPYPGGQHISRLSEEAENENIISTVKLPRPMINSGDLDFSFSGLKTAVLYAVRDHKKINEEIDERFKKGLAKEFEESVKETLNSKLQSAIEKIGARTIIIGGGVSANKALQEEFKKTADGFGIPIYLPYLNISGDNALMIALAGALEKKINSEEIRAQGTKRLGII